MVILESYKYLIEILIEGRLIFGAKYLMLQRQFEGILCQSFSVPFVSVLVLCFLFCLELNQGMNGVLFPYFETMS